MQINDLTLLSGCDIPFEQGRLVIHVPKLKEIAFIGQLALFSGCQMLNFTKEKLNKQDRTNLSDYSNFDIIIAMLEDKSEDTKVNRKHAMSLLALLFPDYQVSIKEHRLIFEKDNQEQGFIDSTNIQEFQKILKILFTLSGEGKANTDYKPMGDMAQRIAEKMRKGRQKISEHRADMGTQFKSAFARQVSILAVGQHKSMNDLMNYTIHQLKDEYERFMLKQAYDLYIQQKMAGAKNVKSVPHWMKDLDDKQGDALTGRVKPNRRKNRNSSGQK